MRTLVTGGAGFIGSHLARRLLAAGARTTILDDVSTGSVANVPEGAAFVKGSVTDAARVDEAMDGASHVFHLAAMASVVASMEDPRACYRTNLAGTLEVLDAARRHDVEAVVFASSSAVYGREQEAPVGEGDAGHPRSPYGLSKLQGEELCRLYSASYGLRTLCLRFFNVYGPGQNPLGEYAAAIPRFSARALAGEPLVVYGDGLQTRDFVHVRDVAAALHAAATHPAADGRALNIGAGTSVAIRDLARLVREAAGSASPVRHAPPRAGEVRASRARIEAARALLGYAPTVPLAAGLAEMVQALRQEHLAAPLPVPSLPSTPGGQPP